MSSKAFGADLAGYHGEVFMNVKGLMILILTLGFLGNARLGAAEGEKVVAVNVDGIAELSFQDIAQIGRMMAQPASLPMEEVLPRVQSLLEKQRQFDMPATAFTYGVIFARLAKNGDPSARLFLRDLIKLKSLEAKLKPEDQGGVANERSREKAANEKIETLSRLNDKRRRFISTHLTASRELIIKERVEHLDPREEDLLKDNGRPGIFNSLQVLLIEHAGGKYEFFYYVANPVDVEGKSKLILTRVVANYAALSSLPAKSNNTAMTSDGFSPVGHSDLRSE
jgi:hypothetical protein